MRGRELRLPLLALVLAALACSTFSGLSLTPSPAALPTLVAASPTVTLPSPATTTSTTTSPAASPTATTTTPPAATPGLAGTNLSNTGKAETPRLAFDAQGILHLIWYDTSARATGDYFHSQQSTDGEWSKAENLTSDLQLVFGDPNLILDANGQICAVFGAAKVSGNPFTIGLYQRCQTGTTWSPAVKLPVSKQPGVTLSGYSAVRAADGTVHAVYVASVDASVYFDNTKISGAGSAAGPALAMDKAGGYHAAWVSLGSPVSVQYRFSGDQGRTWQAAQTLSTDQNAPGGGAVRLVADSVGNVHLLWGDGGVAYRRWTPAGGWGPAIALAQGYHELNLDLAVDGQGLARAVWSSQTNGLSVAIQAADGSWSAPRTIVSGLTGEPLIAVDAQGASHIAWLANQDVFYLALP